MIIPPRAFFSPLSSRHRVRTGHRKPGKSWNLGISFSRPGKPWNLIVGPSTPWQIEVLFRRLVTTDDKARIMKMRERRAFWWIPEFVFC